MIQIKKSIFVKKLLYQSKNRGYKENDLILGNFAERFLFDMNIEDLRDYANILEQNDADIYDWFTHKSKPPVKLNSKIMDKFLNFNINE